MDTAADKKKEFASKVLLLTSQLESWYEAETESIDGTIASGAPAGDGGSIMGTGPAIGSKRVVDASVITKKVLGIPIPPEIIKPGGYGSFDELISHLLPKLEKVYIGELKVRAPKLAKEPATV